MCTSIRNLNENEDVSRGGSESINQEPGLKDCRREQSKTARLARTFSQHNVQLDQRAIHVFEDGSCEYYAYAGCLFKVLRRIEIQLGQAGLGLGMAAKSRMLKAKCDASPSRLLRRVSGSRIFPQSRAEVWPHLALTRGAWGFWIDRWCIPSRSWLKNTSSNRGPSSSQNVRFVIATVRFLWYYLYC